MPSTLWLCPCLRPHMEVFHEDPREDSKKDRYPSYCECCRQPIDLLFLCYEDLTPREYVPKRRRYVG